ncbi:hypothetical protein SISSUDRAFT_1030933 [Sistotremastrum suecicum HHB10207 ss-3]|uniref:Uncharacterized protein n=1 Tax=Sistotremastrum suecicum HHB10207 ss-3 TaxID=1314776 RepID=A0A166GL06_9AGAM|nr:hypothetical protein SISSUDRAFT_1030933 [Sistotremastrum suecicum HHB10207 ss-3]
MNKRSFDRGELEVPVHEADFAALSSSTSTVRTTSHSSPRGGSNQSPVKLLSGVEKLLPSSAFLQYVITPIVIHILIPMPLLVLNPSCLEWSTYFDNRISACSMVLGPFLTVIFSFVYCSTMSSVPKSTPGLNHGKRRAWFRLVATLSWALTGLGYIYAFNLIAQATFVATEWPIWAVSNSLLALVFLYWIVGVCGTFDATGRVFDMASKEKD